MSIIESKGDYAIGVTQYSIHNKGYRKAAQYERINSY